MGEAGKTGHVCVHPCGPHLRESAKHREGVTPRTPAPCPFLLALSCPGGARGRKGPRGGMVHRAGQRHRPPRPRTCSPNLRRQQAVPGSHGTGKVAAVTIGLWSSAPGSAAEPQPSRESPTSPKKGRLPTGGAHGPGRNPIAGPP